ncbi:NfeD family protein [Micromonospora pisi]|uniref:NfeD family protein n=1 Tax=Micromonospora pisi TaxID=589240 RepID=UPI000EB54760|nr:NfeD family protein [Micromonospora pisi]
MEPLLWIVLGVVLLVAEVFTTTLILLMFGVAALVTAGAAALGAPPLAQVLVFALVSALSVVAVRPVIRRHRRSALESGERPFGVEAIEGSDALVLEQVDTAHGSVKIEGEVWSARSYDAGQVFLPGERVRVIELKGVTAMVWRDDSSTGASSDTKR